MSSEIVFSYIIYNKLHLCIYACLGNEIFLLPKLKMIKEQITDLNTNVAE